MSSSSNTTQGSWRPGAVVFASGADAFRAAVERLGAPVVVVDDGGTPCVATGGQVRLGVPVQAGTMPLLAHAPALLPTRLGDATFRADYAVDSAYVVGEMANGIASEALVEAVARAGMLGVFGAAGLPLERVAKAVDRLQVSLGALPFGVNLIHSPDEQALEASVAQLLIDKAVPVVSASAYLDLTLPVVRLRLAGLTRDESGMVHSPRRLLAKVSRVEVARKFLEPAPQRFIDALLQDGTLTAQQAEWAKHFPMADDLTAEADSGGHTDNRPLVVLLPALMALRDEVSTAQGYVKAPRIGAAGGLATPASVASAFAMGAAYVVTGSINQACVESGTSDAVRAMLAQASSTDVAMAPAADMFELGVKVQVLTRGTLFAVRAARLYEVYRQHESIEALPAAVRAELEQKYFRQTLEAAWAGCEDFFTLRDPRQLERAAAEPRHRLALLLRAYLGQASHWANAGKADRALDYQVWCGPAMGAFNAWVKGTALEAPAARDAVTVGLNLMTGAAVLTRIAALRTQGVSIPAQAEAFRARPRAELEALWAPVAAEVFAEEPKAAAPRAVSKDEPIAIVGMGGLFPQAENLEAFWRLLRTAKNAVGDVPATHWSLAEYFDADAAAPDRTYAKRGAFLSPHAFDPTEFGIPPSILEATDTSQLLGLVCARMALEDAGYGEGVTWDKRRASVLLGVTGTQELVISLGARLGHPKWKKALDEAGVDEATAQDVVERIGQSYVGWQENSFPGLLGNVVAGRIANRFDFGGTNCVIDAACASSLGAVHLAMLELRAGTSDVVLTGGIDCLNDIFMHMCFSKTPALSASGDVRPFSAAADGTLLGEGLGMLVLKRLSDAVAAGDRVYATIQAMGTSSDGRAKSIYAPLPQGQARALTAAYQAAGVRPRDIGLVEAHGTGTRAGDAAEFQGLCSVYRADSTDAAWCALGSVKSQVGHTKAAAGAVGLMKTALALHHKVFPPTLKVDAPNPQMKLEASPFTLSTETRPWLSLDGKPRRAAVSSFGFGGSNFHVVLQETSAQRGAPAWDGSVELLALSAPDAAGLLAKSREILATTRENVKWVAKASRASFDVAQPHRLVAVLRDDASVSQVLNTAVDRMAREPGVAFVTPDGVCVGAGAAPGALAMLFPGQGAQGVNMLRDLACVFPELAASVEATPAVAAMVYPAPTFDADVRARREALLTRTENAQPALGAVSSGLLAVLRRFGVTPEVLAGHSYGELVALYASGVLDAAALREVSALRGQAMAGDGSDRGTMLAVMAPLADIEALVRDEALAVVVANRNTPTQGVLSGTREAIAKAEAACQAKKLTCRPLNVGAAFHSALVAPASQALATGLASVTFSQPSVPVVSNTTLAVWPAAAAEAKALLARQLAAPVDFVGVVEALYAKGARTFIEVGPRTALTGMVRATLAARAHTALAVDAGGRGGALADLALVLARLAALGHAVDLKPWQHATLPAHIVERPPRVRRMSVPLTGANHRNPITPRPAVVRTPVQRAPMAEQGNDTQMALASGNGAQASGNGSHGAQVVAPSGDGVRSTLHGSGSVVGPLGTPTSVVTTQAGPAVALAYGDSLRALQAMQAQTARLHQTFLESQMAVQHTVQALLLGQVGTQASVAPAVPAQAVSAVPVVAPLVHAPPAPVAVAPLEIVAPLPVSRPIAAAPVQAAPVVDVAAVLLDVVSEATGYPKETLSLPMDLEADLGIDSIKRVEILSMLSKRIPNAPAVNPEKLSGLRTLAQVADFVGGGAPVVAAAASLPVVPVAAIDHRNVLLEVVAESTGYPVETLELSMDLEADLGIDSIKRVEILSLLSKRVPNAPSVNPEKLSGLRTLQQVLDFVSQSAPAQTPRPVVAAAPVAPPPAPSADVSSTVVAVVAELTGYPAETLELSMDLEADLGIDSIKRVEILSSLSKRVPNAPSVNPEKLSGLRTLQHIVDFLNGATSALAHVEAARPTVPVAVPSRKAAPLPPVAAPVAFRQAAPTPVVATPAKVRRQRVVPVLFADAQGPARLPSAQVLVTRDGAGLAEALVQALRAESVDARILDGAPVGPVGGLVILPLPQPLWTAEAETALKATLRLGRDLGAKLRSSGGLFATVSRRDGAFGHVSPSLADQPLDGGLAGLAKSARHEWPEVRCRALDVSSAWPVATAAKELARALLTDGPLELGLSPAGMVTLALEDQPVPVPAHRLASGDLVVVTGGARGVTAHTALTLGRQTGARMLLLGRSPAPMPEAPWLMAAKDEASIKRALLEHHAAGETPTPRVLGEACRAVLAGREIRATLESMHAAGVEAEYRAVDVRDPQAVAQVLDEARRVFGPVKGLLHGAGVLRDKRLEDKRDEDFDAVVDTKLMGLRSVLSATRSDPLVAIALFASVSGRFGRRGQADYAVANQALVSIAQVEAVARPDCRVVALDWGPWEGGMVTPALKAEFLKEGVDLISLDAGAQALVDELGRDVRGPAEVVVGCGFGAADAPASSWQLFSQWHLDAKWPVLADHRLSGKGVLPLAMTLDAFAQAATAAAGALPFAALEDVRVLRGVTVGAQPETVSVWQSAPQPNGTRMLELRGARGVVHVRAVARFGRVATPAPSPAPQVEPFTTTPRALYTEQLFHGPSLEAIDALEGLSAQGLVAHLRAQPQPEKLWPLPGVWAVDPLVIDGVFQALIVWCRAQKGAPSLPSRLGALRRYAAIPTSGVKAVVRVREADAAQVVSDIDLLDASGGLVARLEGYVCTLSSTLDAAFRSEAEGTAGSGVTTRA